MLEVPKPTSDLARGLALGLIRIANAVAPSGRTLTWDGSIWTGEPWPGGRTAVPTNSRLQSAVRRRLGLRSETEAQPLRRLPRTIDRGWVASDWSGTMRSSDLSIWTGSSTVIPITGEHACLTWGFRTVSLVTRPAEHRRSSNLLSRQNACAVHGSDVL